MNVRSTKYEVRKRTKVRSTKYQVRKEARLGTWYLVLRTFRPSRHAITLLEVLMSMFVLAVGLLSVASLLPVGTFQATRALLNYRAAVLGQNSAREMKTRGLLRPDWWWYMTTSGANPYVTQTATQTSSGAFIPPGTITVNPGGLNPSNEGGTAVSDPRAFALPQGYPPGSLSPNSVPLTPVCIDPWMINMAIKNNYTAAQIAVVDLFARGGNTALRMPRVTLIQNTTGATRLGNLRPSLANDQSFISEDDLAFALDQSNPDTPPALGFNGNGLPTGFGLTVNGVAANGTKRNYNGQFTWLATVVPLYGDAVQVVNRNLVMLSIVTFNQRVALPTAPPAGVTERAAAAVFKPLNTGAARSTSGSTTLYPPGTSNPINKFGSQGIKAAEIQLADINGPASATAADADLTVKPGEWIMLGTMVTEYNPSAPVRRDPSGTAISQSDLLGWDLSANPSPTPPSRPMFRWYRVVAASPLLAPGQGDNATNFYARDLTISGPEWNMASVAAATVQIGITSSGTAVNARDAKNNPVFIAFIYDGAVAVYERTVRIEGTSMWSN